MLKKAFPEDTDARTDMEVKSKMKLRIKFKMKIKVKKSDMNVREWRKVEMKDGK